MKRFALYNTLPLAAATLMMVGAAGCGRDSVKVYHVDSNDTTTPLPPTAGKAEEAAPAIEPPPLAAASQAAAGPPDLCWRYAGGQWRRLPNEMPLGACAQTLFAGRCERAGDAAYGRWAQQTLRLVPGRVEISSDNRSFRPLMDQPGCPPPPAG